MPVRTGYVGSQVAGDVLTAANFTKLPGGWIGYAEVVASQGSITTEVDLTGLTVTVTVGSSRRIKITGECMFASTVADDIAGLFIYEGAVNLQQRGQLMRPATWNMLAHAEVVLTPTAGSHTYKLRGIRWGGSGTVTMFAASTAPAFIRVEDIGPAT